MLSVAARFYDGLSPQTHAVTAALDGPMLRITDQSGLELARWATLDLFLPLQDKSQPEAYIATRAAPDARLVVDDRAAQLALAQQFPALARMKARGSHGGRRAVAILAGVATVAVVLVVIVLWRGPELLAPAVPHSWQAELGDQITTAIVGRNGRCSAAPGQAALDALVAKLKSASGYRGELKVQVIDSGTVNAFAVPGGRIMIFRGLLEQAESPDQVAAVLAHEMGHVFHNHPMRGLLRQLGLTILQRMAFGSAGDSVSSAASMGQTMLALRNGRDAERESDSFAIATLQGAGLKANGLSSFFTQLLKKHGDLSSELGWLSSHPGLDERRQATARDDTGQPALTDAQWQDLQAICSNPADGKPPQKAAPLPDRPRPNPAPAPQKGRGTNGKDRI
jgi:Zn-dependent protease with chaperone function